MSCVSYIAGVFFFLSSVCVHLFSFCVRAVGNELTGNTNLITHYNLEHAYNKFCGKKVKEKLSNFLPELPGEFLKCAIRHLTCCDPVGSCQTVEVRPKGERWQYTPLDAVAPPRPAQYR